MGRMVVDGCGDGSFPEVPSRIAEPSRTVTSTECYEAALRLQRRRVHPPLRLATPHLRHASHALVGPREDPSDRVAIRRLLHARLGVPLAASRGEEVAPVDMDAPGES